MLPCCKKCIQYARKRDSKPACIVYEKELWHHPRMVNECERVISYLRGTIFGKDLHEVKREFEKARIRSK